jgi:hypothetical protein
VRDGWVRADTVQGRTAQEEVTNTGWGRDETAAVGECRVGLKYMRNTWRVLAAVHRVLMGLSSSNGSCISLGLNPAQMASQAGHTRIQTEL